MSDKNNQCPGGAEYGHGMSRTTVHAGGCCERHAQTLKGCKDETLKEGINTMSDKNKYAQHFKDYGIIAVSALPEDVSDEMCNDQPGNGRGHIVNPKYHPKFKAWLEAEQMPVECYIIWWSW